MAQRLGICGLQPAPECGAYYSCARPPSSLKNPSFFRDFRPAAWSGKQPRRSDPKDLGGGPCGLSTPPSPGAWFRPSSRFLSRPRIAGRSGPQPTPPAAVPGSQEIGPRAAPTSTEASAAVGSGVSDFLTVFATADRSPGNAGTGAKAARRRQSAIFRRHRPDRATANACRKTLHFPKLSPVPKQVLFPHGVDDQCVSKKWCDFCISQGENCPYPFACPVRMRAPRV